MLKIVYDIKLNYIYIRINEKKHKTKKMYTIN